MAFGAPRRPQRTGALSGPLPEAMLDSASAVGKRRILPCDGDGGVIGVPDVGSSPCVPKISIVSLTPVSFPVSPAMAHDGNAAVILGILG